MKHDYQPLDKLVYKAHDDWNANEALKDNMEPYQEDNPYILEDCIKLFVLMRYKQYLVVSV